MQKPFYKVYEGQTKNILKLHDIKEKKLVSVKLVFSRKRKKLKKIDIIN